jgi:ankyrin repeat protein
MTNQLMIFLLFLQLPVAAALHVSAAAAPACDPSASSSKAMHVESLCRAAASGDVEAVARMCHGSSLALETDDQGMMPIHHAAMAGQIESLRLLVKIAPQTISSKDVETKRTPAHFAAKR